ncbi:hypothetical protein ACQ4PT_002562 [Festuca glaucescens]
MEALRAVWLGRDQGFEALNEALITLLPKKDGAVELKDFRPIILVHSFAHLLTKVLAWRLAPRMQDLVDGNQTAFIWGRCIQDNFLLVKESAKLLHQRRIPSLLLKVDVAKAFDSISWPFLLSVLRQCGFGQRWIRWIALLLRSASTSVLVNGCAGSTFRHGHGLRQGDPISPLLFAIAMDVLFTMFRSAERSGILADLAAIGLRHRVSLYTNDIVIFAKPDAAELAVVWGVLDYFGMASGLKANFAKNSAALIQCSGEILEEMAEALPCPLAALPCTYLGLPLSIRKPRKVELQAVLDKLAAKLPFWKACLLTREGRLVYVQAVMTASVVYQLLALDLDPWFFRAVDKLRRSFLWVGKDDAQGGCCAVAWDLVCQPKSLGSLGMHDLRRMNVALRARCVWLQKMDGSKPWSGLDVQVCQDSLALFNASVRIELGDGASVLFWEDAWIGGLAAAAITPDLLKLVRQAVRRRHTVRDGLAGNSWASNIACMLMVDVVMQYLRLWAAVRGMPFGGHDAPAADSFRWKWRGDGQFLSHSAYRLLFQGTTGLPGTQLVWNSFAPLKYKMHAWLALRRRCWTADRRLRRGLPSHTICPLCDVASEMLDHLSLHCGFSRGVWSRLVTCLGLPDIAPTGNGGLNDWWIHATHRFTLTERKKANSLRFWLKLHGFHDEAKALWEDDVDGEVTPTDPLHRLEFKLRRTCHSLQRWSQRKVGSIRDLILVANEVILVGCNAIASLRSGDQVVSDLDGKVGLTMEYFMGLLGSMQPRDFDLSLEAIGLQPMELAGLKAQFSEDEVWAAIRAMPSNKSPSPDGFS